MLAVSAAAAADPGPAAGFTCCMMHATWFIATDILWALGISPYLIQKDLQHGPVLLWLGCNGVMMGLQGLATGGP